MTDRLSTPAYLSWGRWVVDCPTDGCFNAKEVAPGQGEYICDNPSTGNRDCCGVIAHVAWPNSPDTVVAQYAGQPAARRSQNIPGSPQDVAAREASK